MARENLLKLRRGTAQEWAAVNPTLDAGEPGFESDTKLFKIGDGSTSWNNLKYVGVDGGNLDAGPAPTTTAAPTTTTAAPTTTTAAPTTTTAAPTTTTAAPTTTTAAPAFNPMAVLLTSGTSYTVPAGATSMKAWAVGAGHGSYYLALSASSARGGSVAYKTWSVSGGQSVAYSINTNPRYQNGPPSYSATGSTADTTVTFNGQTIRGFFGSTGGNPNDETAEGSGVTWLQFSGGDGLAVGGGHQTNTPDSGYYYRGGAAGGNSPSPSCGAGGYRRNVLTDVSGLKAALTLAGVKIIDDCNDPQAFGNGGLNSKFNGVLSTGLGGGAINMQAGNGAVILYFT